MGKQKDKVRVIRGDSQTSLAGLIVEGRVYDIAYVDGSHLPHDALSDVVLSWRLLKEGGLLIVDDFDWPFVQVGDEGRGRGSQDEGRAVGNSSVNYFHSEGSESETCASLQRGNGATVKQLVVSYLSSVPLGAEVLDCTSQLVVKKRKNTFTRAPSEVPIDSLLGLSS